MQKQVINATEGGARIKGTLQMPLREVIEKYCQEPIDKSKLKSLLTLADDGDELVKKVIPLLENDIGILESIIKNSRKGMAVNKGISKLMSQSKGKKNRITKKQEKLFGDLSRESGQAGGGDFVLANHLFYDRMLETLEKGELKNLVRLSQKNFSFSEAAHVASAGNPLVNVAIYGASRQIQGRRLKVDETLVAFLKDKEIAEIRMERNNLILGTAKKAAESLIKSYRETLELLKKYDETKDDKLLRPIEPEEINLDDAEKYFAAGNWAHPLLDSMKNLEERPRTIKYWNSYDIYRKAIAMRDEAIKKAKQNEEENGERESKLLKCNLLVEQSREEGKKGNFETALKQLQEAVDLMPDNQEARWGYATCLNHIGRYEPAIDEYRKLIESDPENYRFRFEMGQVMLMSGEMEEGLKEISEVMKETEEFNQFFKRIGEIYAHTNCYDSAVDAYDSYLKKYPYDHEVWVKKGDCLMMLGRALEANKAYEEAREIFPRLI